MPIRHASAEWRGTLDLGGGAVSTGSRALDECLFGFRTRFENDPGTNPEELLAAAHASCFSMMMADLMSRDGIAPERLDARAAVTLHHDPDRGVTIKATHLDVTAKVAGISQSRLDEFAREAARTCPMSRALNLDITVDALLE